MRRIPRRIGAALVHSLLIALMGVSGVQGAQAPSSDTVSLYGTWEKSFTNTKNYSNPYNFDQIQLDAVFTAPSGRTISFFGFHDGDGNGGQNGDVWKLRFLPDESGAWTYTYTWSDGTPGGSGSLNAVSDGLYRGILKPYGPNPHWFAYNGSQPVLLKSYYIAHKGFYRGNAYRLDRLQRISKTHRRRIQPSPAEFAECVMDRLPIPGCALSSLDPALGQRSGHRPAHERVAQHGGSCIVA